MPRYVLTAPVHGGDSNWEIADTERDQTVVTIHKSVPDAEREARELAERMNAASGHG